MRLSFTLLLLTLNVAYSKYAKIDVIANPITKNQDFDNVTLVANHADPNKKYMIQIKNNKAHNDKLGNGFFHVDINMNDAKCHELKFSKNSVNVSIKGGFHISHLGRDSLLELSYNKIDSKFMRFTLTDLNRIWANIHHNVFTAHVHLGITRSKIKTLIVAHNLFHGDVEFDFDKIDLLIWYNNTFKSGKLKFNTTEISSYFYKHSGRTPSWLVSNSSPMEFNEVLKFSNSFAWYLYDPSLEKQTRVGIGFVSFGFISTGIVLVILLCIYKIQNKRNKKIMEELKATRNAVELLTVRASENLDVIKEENELE
ncbi:hypothetical protein [Carp edema virus]|nr:hypothetical protein [Carp edema virus]